MKTLCKRCKAINPAEAPTCHNCGERIASGPSDATPCSPSSIVDFIRRHNRWRRGDESLAMEDPKAIGNALEAICDRVEELEDKYRMHHAEAEKLTEVIRAATVLIAAKGRHNTMLAYEGLRSTLSTENVQGHAPSPAGASDETGGEG